MSECFPHAALSGALPRLLRRLAEAAKRRASRDGGDRTGETPGRELTEAGQASAPMRQVLHETEERVLADLGLSRRFPFQAAND